MKIRLLWIEATLIVNSELTRKDIMEAFDLAPAQATRSIKAYKDLFPNSIHYDPTHKKYLLNDKVFKNRLIQIDEEHGNMTDAAHNFLQAFYYIKDQVNHKGCIKYFNMV